MRQLMYRFRLILAFLPLCMACGDMNTAQRTALAVSILGAMPRLIGDALSIGLNSSTWRTTVPQIGQHLSDTTYHAALAGLSGCLDPQVGGNGPLCPTPAVSSPPMASKSLDTSPIAPPMNFCADTKTQRGRALCVFADHMRSHVELPPNHG